MNITEANDTNVLLDHLLRTATPPPGAVIEAAARLADRAHKPLSAGLRSADIRARWTKKEAS